MVEAHCNYKRPAHYEDVIAADARAQQAALAAAQQRIIDIQAMQAQAAQDAQTKLVALQGTFSGLSQRLADSVRSYDSLRAAIVPAGTHTSGQPARASAGAAGDQGIAGLAGQAAAGCYHDAAELTALQTWAFELSSKPSGAH